MYICRPKYRLIYKIFIIFISSSTVLAACIVVKKRIKPDIGHLRIIKRKRNSKGIRFSGNGKILKSSRNKSLYFIVAEIWKHKIRMRFIKFLHPCLVFTQAKKIIFFFEIFWSYEMIRTDKNSSFFYKFIIFFKCFAADAVLPFIETFINISCIITVLQDFLD